MKCCFAPCRRIDKKNIKTIIYILHARLPSQHSDSFAALAPTAKRTLEEHDQDVQQLLSSLKNLFMHENVNFQLFPSFDTS